MTWKGHEKFARETDVFTSGGATPGRSRSSDLAGRSTSLAPPYLALRVALFR